MVYMLVKHIRLLSLNYNIMKISEKIFRQDMCKLATWVGMKNVRNYWRHVDLPTFTKELTYFSFIKGDTNLGFIQDCNNYLIKYRKELDKNGFVVFES